MAILMNDAPAAELSNLCDIVAGLDAWLAAQRVSWHAKLSEGEGGTKGWMRRGIRRESEAEIKWRERKGDKGKIWGGGKEKANIQDAVTVRGRCVRPRYNGHGAQELATRDPSCARWIIHDTGTQSPFLSTFLTRPKTAPQPRTGLRADADIPAILTVTATDTAPPTAFLGIPSSLPCPILSSRKWKLENCVR